MRRNRPRWILWLRRLTKASWFMAFASCGFSICHARDRDPYQWGSAMLATFLWFSSLCLTVVYAIARYFTRTDP